MPSTIYGVLGSTGFLGSHLLAYLTGKSQIVVGGSRRTGVDARSLGSLINWISTNNITTLINLAAECGGIGLNRQQPATLWLATTQITASVLEASRLCNISKLCMIGTVCSYSNKSPTPFKEEHLMGYGPPEPTNAAYGVAKLNGLFGSQSYRDQYGFNAIYLLPVNLYGPGDNFDPESSHVIPALIKKFIEARNASEPEVVCWGTGTATREFLYVKDAARAIALATNCYNEREPLNIGSGTEISIKNLSTLIADLVGFKGKIVWDNQFPDGQPRRCLDVSKAKKQFGFEATTSLEDGLRQTIKWYEAQK